MDKIYYEMIDELQRMDVDCEYIQGWAGGYLGNPKREEQRLTDAYNAGYEDGQSKNTNNAGSWKREG